MNTLRNELKSKYSQIPNELVTDLSLCAGSLRVLLYLFTKPDNWNVYNLDICKQLNISERTLTKYWKILLSSKWLRREQKRNEKGILTGGYFYHIGNFTISEKSSESDKRCDYNNNKPIHKEETNTNKKKTLSSFDLFNHHLYKQLSKQEKDLFLEYLSLRVKMKIKNTDSIVDRLLKKYFDYGRNVEVIEKAIISNWKDFYVIKETSKANDEWR